MNLLRTAAKSSTRVFQISSLTRRPEYRLFSTEAQQPSRTATFDPFSKTPPSGAFYARLYGITKHTSKSDVLNVLSENKLTTDDIKHDYNPSYMPMAVHVRFPSRQAYDIGIRSVARKGRYRLEKDDGSKWDTLTPYDGKWILLQGIPRNALPEDILRFLSGCSCDSSSMQIFFRQAFPFPMRMAIVRFPSPALAMHAFITKNREFCLNNQITVRVLH